MKKLRMILALALFTGFLATVSAQDTARYVYVGAEACAVKCHNGEELGHQYDNWKTSRHAGSF